MKWLRRLALLWLKGVAKRGALNAVKRRGVLVYLRALDGTRRAMILAIVVFCLLQLMILALAGAVVSGVLLLDVDFDTKMRVLFYACLALFGLPACALGYLLSARVWFRHSGAERMIEDLKRL